MNLGMKILALLVIVVLSLANCTTLQQQEKAIVLDCQEKWGNPKFDELRKKVFWMEKSGATRYILIGEKVSPTEKNLLLDYADLKEECLTTLVNFILKHSPMVVPAIYEARERSIISFIDLYHGRISYGEYNRLGMQSQSTYMARWQKLSTEWNLLSLAAQRNQLQASQNLIQAAQLIAPQPQFQPNVGYSNCQWYGQQIQCVSY